MQKDGPIIIIEDDTDDQDFFRELLQIIECPNVPLFFTEGSAVLDYLNKGEGQPFLIFSDLNLPRTNGVDLRREMKASDNLQIKCLPFIYYTGTPSFKIGLEAYGDCIQGFFIKPARLEEGARVLKNIISYWKDSYYPELN